METVPVPLRKISAAGVYITTKSASKRAMMTAGLRAKIRTRDFSNTKLV
jgi:hypothetical protein